VVSRRLNWRLKTLIATLGLAVLLSSSTIFSSSYVAAAESDPPLITLKQFCEMERSEVAKRATLRIRGTVTFIKRKWGLVCIQTDDCATKAYMETDADLAVGQLVELTGRSEFGQYANIMMMTGASVIGDGTMPEPALLDETVPLSLDIMYRWSEVEGPIYSASANEESYFLYVAGKEFGVFVKLPRTPELPPVTEMRNFRIRARGIPAMSTDESYPFRLHLLVRTAEQVELTPLTVPEGGIKPRSISETGFRDMRGDTEAAARFKAVVRSVFGTKQLFLSDGTGSLFVELADDSVAEQLVVGDAVEVEGRLDRSLKQPYLRDAHAKFLGKGYSKPPIRIEPREGRKHFANLIQTTGRLVAKDAAKNWMLLRHGALYFRTWYQPQHELLLEKAGIGSQISVVGGCWFSPSDDSAFDIVARDATVLFNIPAPVVEADPPDLSDETIAAGETANVEATTPGDIIGPALMVLLLAFLGTLIWLILRRLKEQERFQESIHEQLSNLSHIARLNTLSEMVGALAHELNQPLASVSNYAAAAEILSKKEPTDSEKLAVVLIHIGKEAFRAGEIIRRLRHLVRKKTPGSLPVQVSEVIHETVELFKTQHFTASDLVQVLAADNLPAVQADSVQIQQVILNLLLNARDATEAQSDRTSAIQVETLSEDGMVYVTVSDNGIGIASSTPDAIFEPYFTTREKGTGLGLAISRTIIETHGGKITAQKVSPFGTRITFSLPISKGRINIAS
jgi:signal transduction histidine kinase